MLISRIPPPQASVPGRQIRPAGLACAPTAVDNFRPPRRWLGGLLLLCLLGGCRTFDALRAQLPLAASPLAADAPLPETTEDETDTPAAIAQLRRSLAARPDDPHNFVRLARLLIQRGKFGQAEDSLDAALRLDPLDVDALMLRAQLAERRQQPRRAAELYHRVLACDDQHVDARLRLARLHLEGDRPDRAGPLLRAICHCNQTTPVQQAEAHWQLGLAYGRQQRWTDAARELAVALPLRPHSTADDWYRLAYARHQAGDRALALHDLTAALKCDPQHQAALLLSSALRAGGDSPDYGFTPPQVASAAPAPSGW